MINNNNNKKSRIYLASVIHWEDPYEFPHILSGIPQLGNIGGLLPKSEREITESLVPCLYYSTSNFRKLHHLNPVLSDISLSYESI